MKLSEARAIAAEYQEARKEMMAANKRFERASRAFATLPLSFDPDKPIEEGVIAEYDPGIYICGTCGHHWDVHRGDHVPTFCTLPDCPCLMWEPPEPNEVDS